MPRTIEIRASFAQALAAEVLAAALTDSGIPRASIEVQHGILPEARFVWRVLIRIVLWSIAGAAPGAAFGWLLAETVGPEGTAGLIVQVVCWMIVGHVLAGMLAGYALLADRSAEEMPPDRPVSLLTVRDVPEDDLQRVRRLIRASNPLETHRAQT